MKTCRIGAKPVTLLCTPDTALWRCVRRESERSFTLIDNPPVRYGPVYGPVSVCAGIRCESSITRFLCGQNPLNRTRAASAQPPRRAHLPRVRPNPIKRNSDTLMVRYASLGILTATAGLISAKTAITPCARGTFSASFSDCRETPHRNSGNDRGFPIRIFNGNFSNLPIAENDRWRANNANTVTPGDGNTVSVRFVVKNFTKPTQRRRRRMYATYCSPNRRRRRVQLS